MSKEKLHADYGYFYIKDEIEQIQGEIEGCRYGAFCSSENPKVPNSEIVTAEELTLYQRCWIKRVIGIYKLHY